ncbi:MAG: glycosyltransferase [Bacteroidales bacterium]|nr:glycosyltransferase [Bacteroidales bacterium]
MDISVVIPLFNEEESLPELHTWIQKVMKEHGFSYEIIMIDDGSNDKSWEVIEKLAKEDFNLKGLKFRRNYGKSAALFSGFAAANGDVVITMDADLQDSPEEIPELYRMITDQNLDIVSGWKKTRYDSFIKNNTSKIYNWAARKATKIKLHDFNCGLKAYRNKVIKSIEVYGEMHRYIPVLAKEAGFTKIGEKPVQHQKRKYGTTKFGLERFVNGFLDLMSISFMTRFGKRPMHFFGTLGILMFFLGFIAAAYLGIRKLYFVYNNVLIERVTESPYFFISLTLMIIGVLLFVGGFLGEMISRNSPIRNFYHIDKKLNVEDR